VEDTTTIYNYKQVFRIFKLPDSNLGGSMFTYVLASQVALSLKPPRIWDALLQIITNDNYYLIILLGDFAKSSVRDMGGVGRVKYRSVVKQAAKCDGSTNISCLSCTAAPPAGNAFIKGYRAI